MIADRETDLLQKRSKRRRQGVGKGGERDAERLKRWAVCKCQLPMSDVTSKCCKHVPITIKPKHPSARLGHGLVVEPALSRQEALVLSPAPN